MVQRKQRVPFIHPDRLKPKPVPTQPVQQFKPLPGTSIFDVPISGRSRAFPDKLSNYFANGSKSWAYMPAWGARPNDLGLALKATKYQDPKLQQLRLLKERFDAEGYKLARIPRWALDGSDKKSDVKLTLSRFGVIIEQFPKMPMPDEIIAAYERVKDLLELAQPDPMAPTMLGWRVWQWDEEKNCIVSPQQRVEWRDPELRVENWSESTHVRGEAGIHALRMPKDWKHARWIHSPLALTYADPTPAVHGIVERFGKYVLGEDGWRAEWVIIRGLVAPTTEIGLKLERLYPEVEVVYQDGM